MSSARTAGSGTGEGEARRAYLELLKLALCDLVGSSTTSVEGLPHGRLATRELDGDDLSLRIEGRDWPRHALTMTGLRRLNDLQRCVEEVVAEGVPGDLIETGAWRGGSSILMRATLDSLQALERTVWVADSFQGFPSGTGGRHGGSGPTAVPYLAAFDFLTAGLEEVRESFARLGVIEGVRFLPGFFADTLPGLGGTWSLIRLDGDTYDATLLGLRTLYPRLSRGGHLIVDDYGALEECRAAVEDFRAETGVCEPLVEVDWTCVRWRRESDAEPPPEPPEPPEPPAAPAQPPAAPAPERPGPARLPPREIPSHRELTLERELEELRVSCDELASRLEEASDELRGVTSSTSWRLTRPLRELARRVRPPERQS